MKRIISVLMENAPGALSRIVGVFSQRGYNVDSLCVAETDDPSLSRLTIATQGDNKVIPSVIGGLNLIAGLVATIMQFLKINELMENHKAAALSFGLLSRNIRLELALAREERTTDGLEFVTRCKNEYDRLIEQSPSIPSTILSEFEKDYPLDNIFTKPEILDVRAIPKLKLAGFTNLKTSSVIAETTKGGPFSKIGELLKGKQDYDAKTKILDSMQSELDDEEDITSVVSGEAGDEQDVEQGRQEE